MRISDWSSDVCSSDLERRDLLIGVGDHRIIELLPLGRFDVLFPALVRIDRIDREPDRLHPALVPFGAQPCDFAQLGRADRREILGVAEEQAPGRPEPLVETDTPLRAVDRKSTRMNSSHYCAS